MLKATLRELKCWANRGLLVQWFPSRLYEELEVDGGKLFAEGPFTIRHEITPPARGFFHCRPVHPWDKVTLGDMCFPRYVPKVFRRKAHEHACRS
jgi:hypothetical protein